MFMVYIIIRYNIYQASYSLLQQVKKSSKTQAYSKKLPQIISNSTDNGDDLFSKLYSVLRNTSALSLHTFFTNLLL